MTEPSGPPTEPNAPLTEPSGPPTGPNAPLTGPSGSPTGPNAPLTEPSGPVLDRATGRPMPCLATGAAMLAVPTALELLAPPPRTPSDTGVGLAVTVVLAVGALGVGLTCLRPRAGAMPALAVLCAALALVLVPPEPIWDGVCGFAGLLFLLAVRLHRRVDAISVQLTDWLAGHRPMLVGAAVTTPAAVAAAEVPAEWSLLAAALAGLASAGVCLLLFRPRQQPD